MRGESEQTRLREAERHQRILSDVSRALLDYVGPDDVEPLRRIVEMVAQSMGDWCSFALVQPDGIIKQTVAWHPDPRQRDLAERIWKLSKPRRWDAGPVETNVLLQRRAIAYEQITDEMLRAGTSTDAEYELLKEVGLESAVAAPMYDGGDPIGYLLLASAGPGGRHYSQDDLDFAFALAGRAALAIRNARLVRALAQERDRQELARKDLLTVMENDPNGIGIFDNEGRLKYASPRLEEYFGVRLRELIGKPYTEIYTRKFEQVAPDAREQLFANIERIFHDPMLRMSEEIELQRPVRRFLERTTVPIIGPTGTLEGRLFVYVDITARRELDRQRSDFLTVAAHELRTPLTPLSMYLQNMERRLARGQPVDQDLAGKARRQVTRLAKLVEDLLDVSRVEAGRLQLARELFDVQSIADHVVGDFRSSTQVHEIVLRRPSGSLPVWGDRQRLEQVFVNLLQNAIKYSPQGGKVLVELERQGDAALVSITDEGIGIPVEDQANLFQRFFRAKNATTRNFAGLGIGLFVSHEIVGQHGGTFSVRSEPGRGSTFSFSLPLAESAVRSTRAQKRVLLVDDDPEILGATGELLREWGYVVDEARDGATGLQLARSARPDVMLVDLMMPTMDGWTFIEQLRRDRLAPDVPVIVFSADRDAREKAAALQADAALRKPFDLDELHALLERLAQGREPNAHP